MPETSAVPAFEGFRLSASMEAFRQSTLREIMAKAQGEDFISFAVGTPGTDLLPLDELGRVSAEVLGSAHRVLQYGLPSAALKERIVELMATRGVTCRPEQVVLTSGSQQGMDLLARLLLDPGDAVALEEAVYDGIQMAVRGRRPRVLSVPSDPEHGIDLDALEALLAGGERPRFLYVIPMGHNPMGTSLAPARRERLLALARRYRMPIVEDDVYGQLGLDGTAQPALRAEEDRWVFYLGSLSKVLAPSLRIGWTVVPEELALKLAALKHASDVDTSTLAQHVVARYLAEGRFPDRLARLRAEYRRRRDALLAALERHLPQGARWNRPDAGIFVWAHLPHLDGGTDTTVLLERAIEEGVAFCPGEAFASGDPQTVRHSMRLSFADTTPERMDEGVRRLVRALAAVGAATPPARSRAALGAATG